MGAHGKHLTAAEKMDLYRAIVMNEVTGAKLAVRFGVNVHTVRRAKVDLLSAGLKAIAQPKVEPPAPSAPEPLAPIQIHDAAFWRRETRRLERQEGELQRVIEELGGIRSTPVRIPDWIVPMQRGRRGKAVIGMFLSDVHDGEVIRADEINGINAFNPEICAQRVIRYFEAGCIIGERWAVDCDIVGAMVAFGGDLISGDIHEELSRTNAMTAHEQVWHFVGLAVAGIKRVKEAFGKVHVVGVPGNHGRTTKKPTAKLYADLSYDTLIVSMVADHFKTDPNVTFQNGKAKDQVTPVFGRTVLTTHGDKIGTRGGQGFAGPMLPIIRGSKKVIEQQGSVDRVPNLIQMGHYHTTGNPYLGNCPVLANGSVPGYSEYGDDLRAAVEPPQQWLYLLHDRWWLRDRQPVVLTDLKKPEKPVVRIPAEMSRA